MSQRRLLVMKTGTTVDGIRQSRGDFERWIIDGLGVPDEDVDVLDVQLESQLPPPEEPLGVVVTGSSAMVSECEAWSERSAQWLAAAVRAETPVLGICYGHQLLAHGLGGRVGPNPRGRQIGTVNVALVAGANGDALLGSLPESFPMHASHVESVLELPPGAELLATTLGDPHHAFRVARRAWGVQFHPEFDADIMRGYLEARRNVIGAEGLDPDALLGAVREAPQGSALLRRFAELVAD